MVQANETSVEQAVADAPSACAELVALAAGHRRSHRQVNVHDTRRHWVGSARTYSYQTHIAINDQPPERLDWLTDVFFNAAGMASQPWYPQFRGGEAMALEAEAGEGIARHQLTLGCFDLGLSAPRCYRQLVSLAAPDAHTRVIIARSVGEGPALPRDTRLAYTLDPNGEVLHFEDGRLHWHHICCTPGAAVLPGVLDRWLINTLRRAGLDAAERRTYREEAQRLRDWLSGPEAPKAEADAGNAPLSTLKESL